MSRRARNIYKRNDGRWEGRFIKGHKNGKALYGAVYAYSYSDVKDKLAAAKEALAREREQKAAGTVSAISEAWLSEASATLKESSINKYEDILRCYILPEFGGFELSDITNEQLMAFSNNLTVSGGQKNDGLSKSTVMTVMSAMNSLRMQALRRNCTVNYDTKCVIVRKEKDEIRVFSVKEEGMLVAWLDSHFDLTALGILLSLFTGIRLGEVCALKWDNFNISEGIFTISKTMQRIRVKGNPERKTEVKIFRPKSDCSVRTIPIPENLLCILEKHYTAGAFLLTGDKESFVEPRTMQNRFKAILKKAGIADSNYHATRHTFATRCVEAGFDIKCLSEILGHADVSITLNRYVHPSMNLKSQNMSKLTGLFPLGNQDVEE